ncbi:hypothetical protein RBI14_15405 [Alcaligenaceae bacterium B3P038]|nr:hypothetical protein [Alcaligenaceae bacterium B3P038]
MISAPQRSVKLAAQLYEVRDAARFLYGNDYGEVMRKAGEVIQKRADSTRTDVLATAIEMAKGMDGGCVLVIMAAAVELIEPSPRVLQ